MKAPKLTPRPDCETCDGSGYIYEPCDYEGCEDPECFYAKRVPCPECEEVNDIEKEQIEKL